MVPRTNFSPTLNQIVVYLCRRCWPDGFDVSDTVAPETFKALKAEMVTRGRVTINSANSDDTIYGCPTINIMSRAWHDWAHLHGGYGFGVEGETNACRLQCQQIRELVSGDQADHLCAVLEAEVIGQTRYYQRHRRFIRRQREFVETYLKDPLLALSGDFGLEEQTIMAPSFA
ncbi:hypothetical protein [Rhizobium sp. MHM7A]|uniref:hypothetical protein n=1 Tax=Rhizobium sp. MHM7A TaxID=2583233 RepID=UPI0011073E2C|nr:hypothetical protein [Rhizobium sp. MHM7A]TLX16201.1 hypothetical protein FFR93_02420 [Rhizobium sp. MHM7A]